MSRIDKINNSTLYIERPHSYIVELGKLVSSVGSDHFVLSMYQLITRSIPLSVIELSEWTIDESQSCVIAVKGLGYTGALQSSPSHIPCNSSAPKHEDHPLFKRIVDVDHSLLIHLNTPLTDTRGNRQNGLSHQCSLISCKANRRYLISLHRPQMHSDFSLQELCFLKSLSETLLPLLERHAQLNRHESVPKAVDAAVGTVPTHTQLQQDFNERLMRSEIALSKREKEACLEFLIGSSVREMAEKLRVKNSSVETYLKRASAKLGISGRHGLAKWMMDA
ncbi:MAG: LuxR C-terminal-related transcriptional regulator [Pseudomonadota bacterium]